MKQTKHFKRTALSKSAKSMVSTLLLLIAMLMPQGAWAANHYDAGYGSWTSTHDADGVKFKITALRMYNYQGNNSQFRSNPEVNVVAEGKTHTFYLGSLTGNTGKDTFYYNGEGNENPYKGSGSFSKVTYDQTQNDIRVKAYFNNQKNDQKVTTNPDKNYKDNGDGSSKWCTADLTIEIYAHTCTKVTIAGNWGDYSDGINKTESYSWTFNLGHTTTVVQTTPATCADTGLRKSNCSCGAAIEEVLPKDPNVHSFNEFGICVNTGSFLAPHYQAPEGEGTAEKPYLVRKYGNLAWLSEQVRTTSNNSFHARQMDDIQCPALTTESLWLPIGCSTEDGYGNVTQHPFSGTYDGGGFLLKGFEIAYFAGYDYTYNGTIFGVVKNATIKNVGVVNSTVANHISDPYSAALCGSAESSTIENCFVVGSDYVYKQSANAPYTAALCGVSKLTNITGCYTSDNYPLIVKNESRTSFNNCYGLDKAIYNTTVPDGFTQINANDVASGALCYTMNGNETNGTQTWYQNLGSGAEVFPRPQENTAYTVYKISHLKCDGVNPNGKYSYSNSNAKGTVDAHTFTFTTDLLPTCTKAGSKSKQCTVCSAKVEESIDMLTHQMIEHAAKEATCTENGTIKYYTCSRSCCSDKYYKDSGAHTTDVYTTVTQSKKPHTFNTSDASQSECTVCHHGFFRYASDKNVVVKPNNANSLQDAKGNKLEIISNENGVMEFNKPLVIIDEYAFYGAHDFVDDLIIPNTVTTIGGHAFGRSGFSGNLIIPNSVTTIGDYAFYEIYFSDNLTLSNSLTTIGNSAFEGCSKFTGNLILPNTLKIIGDKAFYFCRSFTGNLIIPNSVESIGAYAFCYCEGFTGDLTISNSVKIIRGNTFYGCSGFAGKLTIPNSVESIESKAFYLLRNLKSIEMQSVPKFVGSGAFLATDCTKNIVLSDDSYVYTGSNPYFPGIHKVTYNRKGIKNQWGTIVVPFKVNGSGDDYDLYTITRVTADKLSLTKVEGTLAAGTPAVICLKDGLAGNYDLTLTAANNAVNSDGSLQGSSANGLQLVGTYEGVELTANDYFIANNKFWRTGDMSAPVKAAPFRAYLKGTSAGAKSFSLNIDDESATAIDVLNMLNDADAEYYDLNGRRISQLQRGMNIVKCGNG